ncbi:bifunctional phosphoribosylaminoimidazolecarboxamide formyltransferase/IMP cyclohydrolase [archaeon]|nr:bifunctional phosphoribosylaminoimidazolecarboxamide formyltransferase/IMP cyclohydrolase [archaeon]
MKKALISVSDKTGIVDFAKALQKKDIEILSTGGTAKTLKEAGIKVTEVSYYTGFPEIMNGRVKTLHPKIHAAILANRKDPAHMKQLEDLEIEPIDLVVTNLYPFEDTIAKPVQLFEAIEKIDIGGPSMVRAAAKNHDSVCILTNPKEYTPFLEELETGAISEETRRKLAIKAFQLTAHYDTIIEKYLTTALPGEKTYPKYLNLTYKKNIDLRYGENPHQKAALYKEHNIREPSLANAKQIQGKQLSYNNILDLDAALRLLREFDEITAVVLKHNNPCGVATANTLVNAYKTALSTDSMSAFGGIVALNRNVDEDTAKEITSMFMEAVIAPSYSKEALDVFSKKKRLRIMQVDGITTKEKKELTLRKIAGGILVQDKDTALLEGSIDQLQVVTKRKPTEEEKEAMLFAWKVCKHVKSNSVIYANANRTIGIGAGQMSRVDSSVVGSMKAKNAGLDTKGTALASDAFFPFRDGIDAAAKAGVTAIIQPGGSIRDQEIIDACDEQEIAMVFTGMRHFNH